MKKSAIAVLLAACLTGCAAQPAQVTEIVADDAEQAGNSTQQPSAQPAVPAQTTPAESLPAAERETEPAFPKGTGWQDGFRLIIEDNAELYGPNYHLMYALAYIDDDDQPELWMDNGSAQSGMAVFAYDDGSCVQNVMSPGELTYIPYTGLVCNVSTDGNQRTVYVMEMQGGMWSRLLKGVYGEAVTLDEETVSAEELDAAIAQAYDMQAAQQPQEWYTAEEMTAMLGG